MPNDRTERGAEILRKLHAEWGAPNVLGPIEEIAPEFKEMIRDFAFGEIYARPGLDLKSRQLVTVAAMATLNSSPLMLKAHLFGALKAGWTQRELVEALMQVSVYAGFPAAVAALTVARDVFAEVNKNQPKST